MYTQRSYFGDCERFVLNGSNFRTSKHTARTLSLNVTSSSNFFLPDTDTIDGGYEFLVYLEPGSSSLTFKAHTNQTQFTISGEGYRRIIHYAKPNKWIAIDLQEGAEKTSYSNNWVETEDQTVERPPLEDDDCTSIFAEYVLEACDNPSEKIYTNTILLEQLNKVVLLEGSNTCYKVSLFREEPPEETQIVEVQLTFPDCNDERCVSCPTDEEWNQLGSNLAITFLDVNFYDCMWMAYPGGAHKAEDKDLMGRKIGLSYDSGNSDWRNTEESLYGYAFQTQVGGRVRTPNKNNTCNVPIVAELSDQYVVYKPSDEGSSNGKLTVHYKLDGSYGNAFNEYDLVFQAKDIPYIAPGESLVVDNMYQYNQNWKLYNDVEPGIGDRRIVGYGGRALICNREVVTYDSCGSTMTVQFHGMNSALRTGCLCNYYGQGSGAVEYAPNINLDMTLTLTELPSISLAFTPSGYSRSDFCYYRTDYNSLPDFILRSVRSAYPDTPCEEADFPWLTDVPYGSNWSFHVVLWKETRSLAYCYWVSPKPNPPYTTPFRQLTEPFFASGMSRWYHTTVQHYDVNYSGELVNMYCQEGEDIYEIDRPTDATVKAPGQYTQGSMIPNEVQSNDYSDGSWEAYAVGGTMSFTVND